MNLSLKHTIYSLLLILVTTFLFHQYYNYSVNHESYQLMVSSTHETDGTMELYYDIGKGFNEDDKLEVAIVKGANSTVFNFNNENKLKRFRIDFGDHRRGEEVRITSLTLRAGKEKIFRLDESEILKNIEFYSPNVENVNKRLQIIEKDNLFDPYIEFKTLNRLFVPDWTYLILLLFPVLLVNLKAIQQNVSSIVADKEINLLFIILLLVSIPFKEAWTTFVILLWGAYVISVLIRKRLIKIRLATVICFILFIIPLLFGKVSSYSQINLILSFLLFALISIYPLSMDIGKIHNNYVFIINSIALIIIGSWINYILYYADYDNVTLSSYFSSIKYTNENMREWMAFSHPAFMSIFSIIAMFFSFNSFRQKKTNVTQLITTILITIVLTLILGSRIALLLLLIILLLSIYKQSKNKRILLILYSVLGIAIFSTINKIDPIRHHLWSISFTAIKEKPLFGYGLGSSVDLILNKNLNQRSGFDTILDLNHPHNQYISYVLEIGVIGFALLIGLLLYIHFYHKQKFDNTYATLLFIWGILSIVESPFETSKPTFIFCFFLLITCRSQIAKIALK